MHRRTRLERELIELAKRHVEKIRNRDTSLEKEQEELEQRLCEIKTERDAFKKKLLRSVDYHADSWLCPVCFIENGASIEFKPIPGDDDLDKFECSHCGNYVEVEA